MKKELYNLLLIHLSTYSNIQMSTFVRSCVHVVLIHICSFLSVSTLCESEERKRDKKERKEKYRERKEEKEREKRELKRELKRESVHPRAHSGHPAVSTHTVCVSTRRHRPVDGGRDHTVGTERCVRGDEEMKERGEREEREEEREEERRRVRNERESVCVCV